jgi:hypothetical protein
MDAMITQRMTRAKEKDERSLELFNQIRERRGPTVGTLSCHDSSFVLTSSFVQDTSRLPDDSGRIRVGRVDTEAQVRRELSTPLSIVSSKARSHVPLPRMHPARGPTHIPRPILRLRPCLPRRVSGLRKDNARHQTTGILPVPLTLQHIGPH